MTVWIVTKNNFYRGAFSSHEKALTYAKCYGSFTSDPEAWNIWEEEVT